jgi:hypothetical protein
MMELLNLKGFFRLFPFDEGRASGYDSHRNGTFARLR